MNDFSWANDLEVPGEPLERGCLQLRPWGSAAPGLPLWKEAKVGTTSPKSWVSLAKRKQRTKAVA